MMRTAHATDCGTRLVSTCINDDAFWPHAGASQFLGVGGTETVQPGHLGFGLVTSYLSRPILLHTPPPGPGGTDSYAINDQVNGSFLFAYGVTQRLELDVVLPVTFGQGGSGTGAITAVPANQALGDTAMRDVRFGFAYAVIPRDRVDPLADREGAHPQSTWALTARLEVSAPTGDTGQFATEGTGVWIPSLAGDWRRGRLFAGVELGARLRQTRELEGARVGSQLSIGAGGGVDILARGLLSTALEAQVLPTFAEQNTITPTPEGQISAGNGTHIAPAQWMLSVRTAPIAGGDLSLQLGGGGSIPLSSDAAITNPRFRFTFAVRYAPLGRDTDGDGVLDKDDKCPTVHGLPGNPAGDGCPASANTERIDLSASPAPEPGSARPPTETPTRP